MQRECRSKPPHGGTGHLLQRRTIDPLLRARSDSLSPLAAGQSHMEILDSKRASECTVGFENCAAESFSIPIVRVSIERPLYAIALPFAGRGLG
jgi:hypothetical protein